MSVFKVASSSPSKYIGSNRTSLRGYLPFFNSDEWQFWVEICKKVELTNSELHIVICDDRLGRLSYVLFRVYSATLICIYYPYI